MVFSYDYSVYGLMTRTTIQIEKQTVRRIAQLGKFHSTYDSILNELLDHIEKCKFIRYCGDDLSV